MKRVISRKISFVLLLLLLSLFGCKNNENRTEINKAFTSYISAYTGGVISKNSTIKIQFVEPQENSVIDEKTEKEYFDFSPEIDGEAYWIDQHTIEFRPFSNLTSGMTYSARFNIAAMIEVPDSLTTFLFEFKVMDQNIDIQFEGVDAYDLADFTWQNFLGTAYTSDYVENETIEKAIKATQYQKGLSISWEHSPDGKTHKFVIDSLQRTKNKGQMSILWDGRLLGINESGDKTFDVPPLGEFRILDVKVTQQPDQIITVFFSDPINQEQDLEGLVSLTPTQEIKLVKDKSSINIYPSKRLNGIVKLSVNDEVRNSMGYQLTESLDKELSFSNLKPAVELIGNGVILPNTNGLHFPFKSVNLKSLNVKIIKIFENNIPQFLQVNNLDGNREMKRVGRIVYKGEIVLNSEKSIDYGNWNNFSIDLSKLIAPDPGAIYRVTLSFNKQQSLYPCEDSEENLSQIKEDDIENENYDEPVDDWYYYDDDEWYYDDYNYSERENPCRPSYYMVGSRAVSRNILASDIGIIVKGGLSYSLNVAITDLRTTDPISGVDIEVYNFQNQLIEKNTTSSDGFVTLDMTKKPFFLIAKNGNQRGYLRLDDGNALSYSMFDIGGQKNQDGVKGIIYGERGVWRPGDSLFVSFILEDKNNIIPNNHPVVFEFYTPQDQLHQRIVKSKSVNKFYSFRLSTPKDAQTGYWLAKVKVGGNLFSKSLRIESIKPNRLKLKLDFGKSTLSTKEKSRGELELKWLHGAVANNLKMDVELSFSSGFTSFKGFEGFVFDDPSKSFSNETKVVFQGRVNEDGKTSFDTDFQNINNAPGILQAEFKLRAFEEGGDFSIDRVSVPLSPYRSYVGLKLPEGKGWNGSLHCEESNALKIATVDEKGNPIDKKGLVVEIYNVYWRWWWERNDEDNLATYTSNKSKYLFKSFTVDTKNGIAVIDLKIPCENMGRKFIRVIDSEGGHSSGKSLYVTGKDWWGTTASENQSGAEMLMFTTDKETYKVGEKITVDLPPINSGRLLVSLEAGSKVLKTFWVTPKPENTKFVIDAIEEMAPNVYLNISLVQPHNQAKNDLPIRLYGIKSISVESPNTHLEPIITMPKELHPEQRFSVDVKEASGKKMAYTIAIVDDGLLDLTRFKTPDPWSHFYAKEALSVRTWDMYKFVIGSFSGEMAGLLALGGDEYAGKNGGAKANRFKPVVKFLGPFLLEENKTARHNIYMPNYVGSVRTMVIAGDNGAYGSSEKTVPVKKPLMALATLPRVVGPKESVSLPVTIFAMDKNIKEVTVSVETNSLISIDGTSSQTINFSREGDKMVNFRLKVNENIGLGKVKVIAKSKSHSASYDVEIDVRSPNPKITEVISAVIEPGEIYQTDINPIGIEGTNSITAEISSIPPIKLKERIGYLINYPHGCVEQTTSSAFPQLYLSNLIDLNKEELQNTENNIKAAIEKLKSFQTRSGGLSYWPSDNDVVSEWGTNYAGHFVLEAKLKGFVISSNFLNNWTTYQSEQANNWVPDPRNNSSDQLTQAYRLYTLALAKNPALGAMNRMKSLQNLSPTAKWRLAAAYALIGKLEIAESLTLSTPIKIAPYSELSETFGSDERDKAMILETFVLLGKKVEAKNTLEELSKMLSSNDWFSTQTTAYMLLSISKFVGNSRNNKSILNYDYSYSNGALVSVKSNSQISQINLPKKSNKNSKLLVKNTTNSTLFLKVQLEGIPSIGDKTNADNGIAMIVKYFKRDGSEIDPTQLPQGTDFYSEVHLTHIGASIDYKELALTQVFPSGWEIRNLRLEDDMENKLSTNSVSIKYQDIRDDRVFSYFDLNRNSKVVVRTYLHAAYIGEFYLPTISCEVMYDNSVNARKAGKWVKVVSSSNEATAEN